MVCIVGVDLFCNKCGVISLIYIFGIGCFKVVMILEQVGIDENVKVEDWMDENVCLFISIIIDEYIVEGELCFEV